MVGDRPLGVGVIGAGAVTQAIHVPTIASLGDRLRVIHVFDVAADVAEAVATCCSARSTTDLQVLLDDPAVDVVAICSPHAFHAEHVEAACAAGKRAILCEKPLAVTLDQVWTIDRACRTAGAHLIVGAMHTWDPAYVAASAAWGDLPHEARLVRSVIYLPDNASMVDSATELLSAGGVAPGGTVAPDTEQMHWAALGLAIHNLPLVRQFVPTIDEVSLAANLRPWGYVVALRGGDCLVELIGMMPGEWRPDWTFDVWAPSASLHVSFPPSYVLAGSAQVLLRAPPTTTSWRFTHNGYQAEWQHLADVVDGRAELAIPLQTAVDDMTYALDIAERAEAALQ